MLVTLLSKKKKPPDSPPVVESGLGVKIGYTMVFSHGMLQIGCHFWIFLAAFLVRARQLFWRRPWRRFTALGVPQSSSYPFSMIVGYMGMGQNPVPLVNPKIAGKWMFIPLKMVLIAIDP